MVNVLLVLMSVVWAGPTLQFKPIQSDEMAVKRKLGPVNMKLRQELSQKYTVKAMQGEIKVSGEAFDLGGKLNVVAKIEFVMTNAVLGETVAAPMNSDLKTLASLLAKKISEAIEKELAKGSQ